MQTAKSTLNDAKCLGYCGVSRVQAHWLSMQALSKSSGHETPPHSSTAVHETAVLSVVLEQAQAVSMHSGWKPSGQATLHSDA